MFLKGHVGGDLRSWKYKRHADVLFAMISSIISYKQMMRNGEIVVIDRFYPSSQICCVCGNKDGKKDLSTRKWICPHCESFLERDINAAINLLDAGGLSLIHI